MKKIGFILILLLLSLTLMACGNDDIIGKWNLDEAEALGIELIMTVTDDQIEVLGEYYDYSISGRMITIENDESTVEAEFSIKGDTLTLGTGDDSQVYSRIE